MECLFYMRTCLTFIMTRLESCEAIPSSAFHPIIVWLELTNTILDKEDLERPRSSKTTTFLVSLRKKNSSTRKLRAKISLEIEMQSKFKTKDVTSGWCLRTEYVSTSKCKTIKKPTWSNFQDANSLNGWKIRLPMKRRCINRPLKMHSLMDQRVSGAVQISKSTKMKAWTWIWRVLLTNLFSSQSTLETWMSCLPAKRVLLSQNRIKMRLSSSKIRMRQSHQLRSDLSKKRTQSF